MAHLAGPHPLTRLRVENLFDLFTHEIALDGDRVTIIAGPNGFGKTHLLKSLKAFLTLDLAALAAFPASAIEIHLGDTRRYRCERIEREDGAIDLEFVLLATRFSDTKSVLVPSDVIENDDSSVLPAWINRVGEGRWFDERHGRYISERDIERRFSARGAPGRQFRKVRETNPWLQELTNWPAPIFIDTKRLDTLPNPEAQEYPSSPRTYSRPNEVAISRIAQYMQQVRGHIAAARRASLARQQSSEEKLAADLLASSQATVKSTDLEDRYQRLLDLNVELASNGLAAKSIGVDLPTKMNPTQRRILNVVLENWEKRLQPLLPVHERLTLLRSIVNQKFFSKDISFDDEGGLNILAMNGHEVALNQLSSGEQHLLALFSLLLFGTEHGSLVLIDEPEISLHAAWQHAFLRDIQKVAVESNLTIILATHSTAVINGRWDLVRELGPLEDSLG